MRLQGFFYRDGKVCRKRSPFNLKCGSLLSPIDTPGRVLILGLKFEINETTKKINLASILAQTALSKYQSKITCQLLCFENYS